MEVPQIALALVLFSVIGMIVSQDRVAPRNVLRQAPWASIANVLLGSLTFLTLAAVPLLITTFIAETSSEAVWATGWMLTAFTLPMALGATIGPHLSRRILTVSATALSVVGFLLATRVTTDYWELSLPLLLVGLGLGAYLGPLAAHCMAAAGTNRQGAAASTVILQRLIGMAVGTAALTGWILRELPELTGTLAERITQGRQLFSTLFLAAASLSLLLGAIHSRSHQTVSSATLSNTPR